MAKTLVIELPDELAHQLEAQATRQNTSLENIVLQWLTRLVRLVVDEVEVDPITPLLGTLTTEVNDVGERHDAYLGNVLQQELESAE